MICMNFGHVWLFEHSTPPYWLLSPSEENRVSRRPSVVVMQPIEDRVCDDTTICLGCSRHGLFLPKALVWPSLVEEADVLRDEAQQMVLPEHEHMVEQFALQSADEALGEGRVIPLGHLSGHAILLQPPLTLLALAALKHVGLASSGTS